MLDPEQMSHRFYRRDGELLVEFAQGSEIIHAHTVPGFWIKRSWLNANQLPEVLPCLAEINSKKGA